MPRLNWLLQIDTERCSVPNNISHPDQSRPKQSSPDQTGPDKTRPGCISSQPVRTNSSLERENASNYYCLGKHKENANCQSFNNTNWILIDIWYWFVLILVPWATTIQSLLSQTLHLNHIQYHIHKSITMEDLNNNYKSTKHLRLSQSVLLPTNKTTLININFGTNDTGIDCCLINYGGHCHFLMQLCTTVAANNPAQLMNSGSLFLLLRLALLMKVNC